MEQEHLGTEASKADYEGALFALQHLYAEAANMTERQACTPAETMVSIETGEPMLRFGAGYQYVYFDADCKIEDQGGYPVPPEGLVKVAIDLLVLSGWQNRAIRDYTEEWTHSIHEQLAAAIANQQGI